MLSKPNKAQTQHADVTRTLSQIVTLLEPQAILLNITIESDYDADRSNVFCDENQLKQAFINFLKNACEAMPQGGSDHPHFERGRMHPDRVHRRGRRHPSR